MRHRIAELLSIVQRPGSGRVLTWAAWPLVIAVAVAIGFLGASRNTSPQAPVKQQLHTPFGSHSGPPARVCGNNAILRHGPVSPPRNAISVPAGNDSTVDWSRANTIYWFASGVHTLGAGMYTQIVPGRGSTYIGAPGAVLDGRDQNNTAFGGNVVGVRIEYLTIQHFDPPGNQGAVNATAAPGWTVKYNTMRKIVPGTALYVGTNNVVDFNCLTGNGQSGFGTYTAVATSRLTGGASNVTIDGNEISYNDTCNWERVPNFPGPKPPDGCTGAGESTSCGCSGGGKFWETDGGRFVGNYVHDNYSVGAWWDSNNVSFDIEDNYISGNYGDGLIYEISYNALIKGNTFIRNALGSGKENSGFPDSAVFISESGADKRVPGRYTTSLRVTDNTFVDNWSGVVLWENSNRFCNSPVNTTAGVCTLVDSPTVSLRSCDAKEIGKEPYYSDCRWKTQHVSVDHNVFDFNPDDIGRSCTVINECGFQGLFSEYGTYPAWSPYRGDVVGKHVAFAQDNHFSANIYSGPWRFLANQQGNVIGWRQWQISPYSQDVNSAITGE